MKNKKLNIIYHFRVRGTGAEGVHIAGIVNGFRSLGHKVVLVSPTNVDPTKSTSLTRPSEKNNRRITKILHKMADTLPQPFFELMEIAYNTTGIIRLLKAIKQVGGADLIYERYAFFNFSGVLVSKIKGIPLIIEVNELSGLKRVRGQSFVGLCSFIEKRVLRQAKLVITVSDFLNKEVLKKVDRRKVKVVTVPNGVPLSWLSQEVPKDRVEFLRKKFGLQDKKVICFVGGLVHWHNFDLLLQAVRGVQNIIGNLSLMIIGDGPLKSNIKNKAKVIGIQQAVIFVGNVPHSDIPYYLKLSNAAVIPETNDFRSPIKLFEYMAMGTPVIAPRMPAIEAIIQDGKDGMLFVLGDKNSFCKRILCVLMKPDMARQISKSAFLKIKHSYTWEQHAGKILSLLKSQQRVV